MVPPNMMGKEFDEENIMQEEIEARRNPLKDVLDNEDDHTCFEISIVNRADMAMNIDCKIHNGEITFGKVRMFGEKGLINARKTWVDRQSLAENKDGSLIKNFAYNGPTFTNLSEPVQNTMLEYLYECGLRPEIGIAVEYLSWNKEQRLYMAWLRDLSFYLSNEV